MSAASEREASFEFGGAQVWREGGSLFLTFMGMRREFRPAEWQAIQAFLDSEAPRQSRAMADLFDTKDGVCLTCGGGVLNDGSHIDPARHDAEIQAEDGLDKIADDAATEGPWGRFIDTRRDGDRVHRIGSEFAGVDVAEVSAAYGRGSDAEFIARARQDIPDLLAVIDAVRELHPEGDFGCPNLRHRCSDPDYRGGYCPDAGASCEACGERYPCPTIRALGGAQ